MANQQQSKVQNIYPTIANNHLRAQNMASSCRLNPSFAYGHSSTALACNEFLDTLDQFGMFDEYPALSARSPLPGSLCDSCIDPKRMIMAKRSLTLETRRVLRQRSSHCALCRLSLHLIHKYEPSRQRPKERRKSKFHTASINEQPLGITWRYDDLWNLCGRFRRVVLFHVSNHHC